MQNPPAGLTQRMLPDEIGSKLGEARAVIASLEQEIAGVLQGQDPSGGLLLKYRKMAEDAEAKRDEVVNRVEMLEMSLDRKREQVRALTVQVAQQSEDLKKKNAEIDALREDNLKLREEGPQGRGKAQAASSANDQDARGRQMMRPGVGMPLERSRSRNRDDDAATTAQKAANLVRQIGQTAPGAFGGAASAPKGDSLAAMELNSKSDAAGDDPLLPDADGQDIFQHLPEELRRLLPPGGIEELKRQLTLAGDEELAALADVGRTLSSERAEIGGSSGSHDEVLSPDFHPEEEEEDRRPAFSSTFSPMELPRMESNMMHFDAIPQQPPLRRPHGVPMPHESQMVFRSSRMQSHVPGMCIHGKVKRYCILCSGCPHGKLQHSCRICYGCEHGKRKSACAICKPCPHGKLKQSCLTCNTCIHGRCRARCIDCKPFQN